MKDNTGILSPGLECELMKLALGISIFIGFVMYQM